MQLHNGIAAEDFKGLKRRGILVIGSMSPMVARFRTLAESDGLPVTHVSTVGGVESFAEVGDYAYAVLDVTRAGVGAKDTAHFIDAFFDGLPVFVVGEARDALTAWPPCVRGIFSRNEEPSELLRALRRA